MSTYEKIAQSLAELLGKEGRIKANCQALAGRGEPGLEEIVKREEKNHKRLIDVLYVLTGKEEPFPEGRQTPQSDAYLLLQDSITDMLAQSKEFVMTARLTNEEGIRDTLLLVAEDKIDHANQLFERYVRLVGATPSKGMPIAPPTGIGMPQTSGQTGSQTGGQTSQAQQPSGQSSPSGPPPMKQFTLTELAQFNGQGGKPAYVAVNGVVYDVTNNPQWQMGNHFGLTAGKDLTQELSRCHAGQDIVSKLPRVGILT